MDPKDAAVLFVDISGSTAFFDRYGEVAGRSMVERCFQVVVPPVEKRAGRIVKYLGDGFLAIFPTADDLVGACIDVYTALADENESRPDAARIRIHSGGDVGPAVFDETGDVFGDVVNTAARVQGMAGPDQIYVTNQVAGAITPAANAKVRRVGSFPLKGKEEEVELFEVMWKFDGATMVVTRVPIREAARASLFYTGAVVELPLEKDRLTIGRTPGNDLVVDDGAVSREHAEVVRRKGAVYLQDHSTNGTYLRPDVGKPRHIHREETPIEGSGQFSLGRPDGPPVLYKVV
jgi:adenylate cyclase